MYDSSKGCSEVCRIWGSSKVYRKAYRVYIRGLAWLGIIENWISLYSLFKVLSTILIQIGLLSEIAKVDLVVSPFSL